VQADVSLDCIGLNCPMPIVKTSKKMKELSSGQVLEILADDEGIKEDMPAWCNTTGNEFLGVEEEGNTIKVYVKKS
jgi:TusA-related sulfurtransferase